MRLNLVDYLAPPVRPIHPLVKPNQVRPRLLRLLGSLKTTTHPTRKAAAGYSVTTTSPLKTRAVVCSVTTITINNSRLRLRMDSSAMLPPITLACFQHLPEVYLVATTTPTVAAEPHLAACLVKSLLTPLPHFLRTKTELVHKPPTTFLT